MQEPALEGAHEIHRADEEAFRTECGIYALRDHSWIWGPFLTTITNPFLESQ